nr:somatostatin receptor type 2-like [Misgurnus anguillicaudatus]
MLLLNDWALPLQGEQMNGSTWNFSSPEDYPSTNRTTHALILNYPKIVMTSFNVLFSPIHCYVLWFIATGRGGGIASEFFIFNQTICEAVFSVSSLIFLLSHIFSKLLMTHNFLLGVTITGRPLFGCLICVERYLAVVHPVTFLKYKPLRYKMICSAPAWIVILGACFFCMISLNSSNTMAYVLFFLIQFPIFISVQLFCCLAVLKALKQSGPGERGKQKEEENQMKRRAFHIILIATLIMAIMFLPFIFTGVFYVLQLDSVSVIWSISLCLYVLSGFVNPLIYLQRNGKLSCLCSPKPAV